MSHPPQQAMSEIAREANLHPRLAEFLQRLHQSELIATGAHRRPAFRLTREVIGAALDEHVSITELATCLDVTVGSVRGRAERTGATITAAAISSLTGLTPRRINQRSRARLCPVVGHGQDEGPYRVIDIVRALLALPR